MSADQSTTPVKLSVRAGPGPASRGWHAGRARPCGLGSAPLGLAPVGLAPVGLVPRRLAAFLGVFAALVFALPAPAAAQASPEEAAAPASISAGDPGSPAIRTAYSAAGRDLSRYKEEQLPGGNLLAIAYAVIWAIFGLLFLRMAARQRHLQSELRTLRERIDDLTDEAS